MKRVRLASGIELDVLDEGPRDAPVLIFLHGFPESHRTWRHQIAHFSGRFRCIAPDQRGYRGSSKPQDVASYKPEKLAGDIFQLADALGIGKFTVVGHDWGGAIAWFVAVLGQNSRVERAVIANAPHPAIFQKLIWTDPVQRSASQYMRTFRDTANDALVQEFGLVGMLGKAFDPKLLSNDMEQAERDLMLTDWQDREAAFGMLNWYRASSFDVPPLDAPYGLPDGWAASSIAAADHSDAGDLGDGRRRPAAVQSGRTGRSRSRPDFGARAGLRAFRDMAGPEGRQRGDGRVSGRRLASKPLHPGPVGMGLAQQCAAFSARPIAAAQLVAEGLAVGFDRGPGQRRFGIGARAGSLHRRARSWPGHRRADIARRSSETARA